MAKASWLHLDPASGSGNGSIINTASVHTGRQARSCIVTVTAAGVSKPATYKVTQSPKTEFVQFENGAEMSAPKAGGTLTIVGKTNSNALTFAWVGSVPDIQIPSSYQANGSQTNNSATVEGDPGATSEFEFSIVLNFPENKEIVEKERVLKVTAAGGQIAQITIKQAAGDAFITISPLEITLDASGEAKSVTVNSNTTWTAS